MTPTPLAAAGTGARRRPVAIGVAAGVAAVGLLLAGCTPAGPPDQTDPATTEATDGATATAQASRPADLELPAEFTDQQIPWQECETGGEDLECAVVEAPLDYSDPDAGTVELAVTRSAQAGQNAPHLLVNPGGPGGSGVDMVRDGLELLFSDRLREHYTVVGFDPRGVARSTPVECLSDEQMDEARQEQVDPSTDEGLAELREGAAEFAAACEENTGQVLGHMGTDTAARDLELLRQVLGDEQLSYLGFSYGTALGTSYAEQFPQHVGRMVLDGAMDPRLGPFALIRDQAEAFEEVLLRWAESCLASDECPLSGTPENAVQQVRHLIGEVEAQPLVASDGRLVTAATLVTGLLMPLYGPETWPHLDRAVAAAMNGDPDLLLVFADLTVGRAPDGSYPLNLTDAFTAVNCLDFPMASDEAAMRQQAAELEQVSPTFGPFLGYGGATCADWPVGPVDEPGPATAAGAAPIVVIGTTGDAATPYQWADALADQLQSGVLVSWDGEGHTAYGRAGACIEDTVDDYLVDGTVPEDGLRCE